MDVIPPRDGLVAALTAGANARIDAAVTDGTLTAEQAAAAKQKLSAEIAKIIERTRGRSPTR